jgi:NAD(P)-dependent dehydrogenase (short-subunit alcohol dehydrogenase family)
LLAQNAFVFGIDKGTKPDISHERFHFMQQDYTETTAPQKIVSECLAAFNGRIDALLNIVGIFDTYQSVETVEDDEWDLVMDVNVRAPVRLTKEVVRVMKRQKSGSIVFVSSKAGLSGSTGGAAYIASKHALVSPSHSSSDVEKS